MGFFVLFLYYYCGRSYLEICNVGLYSATIAGMVLVYRGKYLFGGLLTAIFVALQIVSNHVQMSYYFLFVMLFMAVAFGVSGLSEERTTPFF